MISGSHRTPVSKEAGVRLRTMTAGLLGVMVGLAGGVLLRDRWVDSNAPGQVPIEAAKEQKLRPRAAVRSEEAGKIGEREIRNRPTMESGGARVEVDPAVLVDLVKADQPGLEARVVLFSDGDRVAEALAMSETEKAGLEGEWARVRDRVASLQKERLRYVQGDDDLWIGAESFEGEDLRKSFRKAALGALGPERGEAFLELVRADEAFGEWGRRTSSAYSIRYLHQSDGTLTFRITESPSPQGPAGRSWISSTIPPHIREMTDFLGIDPETPDS